MAHYDPHGNRGYDGYAVVGYSATSESRMASTEEVVTMSGYPVRPDLHGQIWPRGSTLFQPKTSDEYNHSPKFAHINGSPHDSPRKAFQRASSPPKGQYGSSHDSPRMAFQRASTLPKGQYGSPHDSPRKAFQRASSPPKGQYPSGYGAHLVNPNDSPLSPMYNHANGDLPRKTTFHGINSPPAGHFSGKYGPHPNSPRYSPQKKIQEHRGGFSSNEDDSSDEDGETRDGVFYPTTKYGADRRQGYDYDKEKKKGNGYAPGNYPVHHTTDQRSREDPYRQKSDGQKYYGSVKQPEGNIHGSHLYDAPARTKPTAGAHYNSENEPYAVPAPIKTRSDRHDGRDNGRSSPLSATAHWTPFAESPSRGNQGRPEMIGNKTAAAQMRYGSVPLQYGAAAADRKFAIDSKTAAAKYGGVFVN